MGTMDPFISIYGSVTCKMDSPKQFDPPGQFVSYGCDLSSSYSNAITTNSSCVAAAKELGLPMGKWNYQIGYMQGCYRGANTGSEGPVAVFWGESEKPEKRCTPGSQEVECLCTSPAVTEPPRFPAGTCLAKDSQCDTRVSGQYCCLPNVCLVDSGHSGKCGLYGAAGWG